MTKLDEIGSVLKAAKRNAVAYYRLTGKPLGGACHNRLDVFEACWQSLVSAFRVYC